MKLNSKYYLLRHREELSNAPKIASFWPEKFKNPLTEKGVESVKKSAEELKRRQIDLIFTSDLLRTKQIAEIIGRSLKLRPKFDKGLRELNFRTFNGSPKVNFDNYFKRRKERLHKSAPNGETYEQVAERVMDFLEDTYKSNKGKSILIVSHECPLWILRAGVQGVSLKDAIGALPPDGDRIRNGQVKELN